MKDLGSISGEVAMGIARTNPAMHTQQHAAGICVQCVCMYASEDDSRRHIVVAKLTQLSSLLSLSLSLLPP